MVWREKFLYVLKVSLGNENAMPLMLIQMEGLITSNFVIP